MANLAASLVDWLQSDALYSRATDATMTSRWGDLAVESSLISPLALKADTDAEAARQIAFLANVLAVDTHLVKGAHRDKLGQVVTLTIAELGYDAGVDVFVIGAEEDRGAGMTSLTVLRRLT